MSENQEESQQKAKSNIRAKRKRNQSQSQDAADNSAEVHQPLSSLSDEIPGTSKEMQKLSLTQQKQTGKETSTTSTFFDDKKDIARAKHGVLSNYLAAWFPTLCNNKFRISPPFSNTNPQYSRLVYVDGFSGPGRYKENDDTGSPLIAYLLALTHNNLPANGPEIYMIFIEKNKIYSEDLLENLKRVKSENLEAENVLKVKFMVINATFAKAMDWILSDSFKFTEEGFLQMNKKSMELQSPSQSSRFVSKYTPFFVFVDPFGYNGKDIPMTLMQKIMQTSKKAEILINLMTGFIQRFAESKVVEKAINLLVGQHEKDSSWKQIVLQPDNDTGIKRVKAFVDHYREKVSEQNETSFAAIFEMRRNKNQLAYNLFFVCQHKTAFVSMKKSMRKSSQSDINFKFSSFQAKKDDPERETVQAEALVPKIFHHFNAGEFQGQTIVGRQITEFINDGPVLYQRYRVQLKHHLNNFRTDRETGQERFDEMTFKFILQDENHNDIEY